jgi:hypothetical protein
METHKSDPTRRRLSAISNVCQAILLLASLAWPEGAQPQTPVPQSAEDTARLTSGIHRAKPEAIVEAGDTHNPVFIKDLRALQESLSTKGGDVPRLLRISLAKLGDRDALQETYCRVQSQYPLIKQNAIENDLTKIGGWFSIWLLERQFKEDDRWRKAPRKYWKSVAADVILVPPSNLALLVLPKLVEDPPLPSLTPLTAQMPPQQAKIDTWKTWIDAHTATLRTLEPTGQDVNTSPTGCTPYRAKEKQWLSAITH